MVSQKTSVIIKAKTTTSVFGVINKTTAGKLKPRNKTYHFRDTKLQGFSIAVHPTGSKRYVVRKRPLGVAEAKPIIIGDTEVFTAKEARAEAVKLISQVSQGLNPLLEKEKAKQQQATVMEMLEKYFKFKKPKEKTIKDYRALMNNRLSIFANKPINLITVADISNWYEKNSDAPRSADIGLSILKNCFDQAVAIDIVKATDNPIPKVASMIKRPEVKRKKTELKGRVLEEFITALFHLGRGDLIGVTARDWILFKLATGTRSKELSKMEWKDVDRKKMIYTLHDTKTGVPLEQAITPLTQCILNNRGIVQKSNNYKGKYVFETNRSDNTDGYFKDARKAINQIKAFGSIKAKITPHDFRNVFITLAEHKANVVVGTRETEEGHETIYERMNTSQIKTLVGHKKTDVTEGYSDKEIGAIGQQLHAIQNELSKCVLNAGEKTGDRFEGLFDMAWYGEDSYYQNVGSIVPEYNPIKNNWVEEVREKTT